MYPYTFVKVTIMKNNTKAIIDPNKPNLDFDGDDPIPVNLFRPTGLRNKQMVSRVSVYIVVKGLDYLKTLGNDSNGVPFADYDISAPVMQLGDRFLHTLIDIRARTVIHVAVIERSKTEPSGSYVMYVFTRNGHLVHRVAATDSVIEGIERARNRVAEANAKAITETKTC